VVALCKEVTQASAGKPELIDKDFFSQCVNARGAGAEAAKH
jgi:hypothetical protein